MSNHGNGAVCPICHQSRTRLEMISPAMIRPPIVALAARDHPDWNAEAGMCMTCLNRYRADLVESILAEERGELGKLEAVVVESLRNEALLARNTQSEFDEHMTFGERIADRMADFGGSWRFLISFSGVILIWIMINVIGLLSRPFDPFPFILLNLVLSCLASVQAPIIMMSQNRQEARDRVRAEHDYQVNLKAELEIRQLHHKFDQMLNHQWQHLMEIQQIQTDLIQTVAALKK